MGVSAILLLSFLSFIDPLGNLPGQRDEGFFEIKVLSVPAFQSHVVSVKSQKEERGGGVEGTMVGGNVTTHFPEGYIVLKTSSNADYDEIQRIIKKKMASFPCSCGNFVQMNRLATQFIKFNPTSGKYDRFEFCDYIFDRIITGEYLLFIEPIVGSHKDICLSFEIRESFGSSRTAKRANRYFKEEIFNRMIDMKPDQVLLVGFAPPKFNNKYRGSAYWFIIRTISEDAY